MSDTILIDTNLWVYLHAQNPQPKYLQVKQLIDNQFDHILCSAQILGELYHVITRKQLLPEKQAKEVIHEIIATFSVIEIGIPSVQKAITIHEQYKYAYWDSLVIATALLHDCQILYSEDMQHDQLIENTLRIQNPFLK